MVNASPSHILARFRWPGSARHLAAVRIVIASYLAYTFLSPVTSVLLAVPAGIHPTTHTVFPSWAEHLFVRHMHRIADAGLVLAMSVALGLFVRATLPLLLLVYLITQNYYFRALTAHDDWLYFTFCLLVMCFARTTDAWALDNVLFKRRRRDVDRLAYRWPVELMTLWFSVAYMAAGLAKLFPLRKGIIWLNGASAQRMALFHLRDSPFYWVLDGAPFDYSVRWPFMLMSWGGVAVELSAVLLLFSRRLTPWVIMGVLGLHISIYWFGISGFTSIVLAYTIVFLDPQAFERPRAPAEPAAPAASAT